MGFLKKLKDTAEKAVNKGTELGKKGVEKGAEVGTKTYDATEKGKDKARENKDEEQS